MSSGVEAHCRRLNATLSVAVFGLICCAACSSSESTPGARAEASGASGAVSSAGSAGIAAGSGGASAPISGGAPSLGVTPESGDAAPVVTGPSTPPDDFTLADIGAWKLGDPLTDSSGTTSEPSTNGCGNVILGVVRDFEADYDNFETPDESHMGDDKGIVAPQLGTDKKPVYAHTGATKTVSGADAFDQFYRDVDGVNLAYKISLFFAKNGAAYSFSSAAYFPVDGKGFDAGTDPGLGGLGASNNFSFTTEIHTQFKYRGGESFTFAGDDDVWVFINDSLAIDLGGVHTPETGKVDLDTLGLTVGQTYPFDMFQAERHSVQSNFRADTDLDFVDCGTIVPK
ncbi:MAG: fibro-slime domain-containing protein [Polyangiaceae bacterium]